MLKKPHDATSSVLVILTISVCLFLFVFVCFVRNVEARMRANTQNVQQGEQETRGVGEGRTKQWGIDT